MRGYLLLVPALLFSFAATGAIGADETSSDAPQRAPERWGDLAPEYGSCDEPARAAGVGAPWISSSAEPARDGAAQAPTFDASDSAPAERRPQ